MTGYDVINCFQSAAKCSGNRYTQVQVKMINSFRLTRTLSPHHKTIFFWANLDEKSKLPLSRYYVEWRFCLLPKPTPDIIRRRPSQSKQLVYLENSLTPNQHILSIYPYLLSLQPYWICCHLLLLVKSYCKNCQKFCLHQLFVKFVWRCILPRQTNWWASC